MHINKDLGSIKSSPSKTSESIKSDVTCCSKSFARALVIGPILISLGLFIIGSSLDVGGATVVGMSSSRARALVIGPVCVAGEDVGVTLVGMSSSIAAAAVSRSG